MKERSWGEWAFLAGIVLAVLFAIFPPPDGFTAPDIILAVLGLLVGLLNITAKETLPFLVASIALLLAGSSGLAVFPGLGWTINNTLLNISQFVAPAAMIVALKAIIDLARRT